ncbi:MAG: hypothetical protein AAGF26_10775 [Cyanobacteria bacterium P01_G01_bin.49]
MNPFAQFAVSASEKIHGPKLYAELALGATVTVNFAFRCLTPS